MWSGDSHVDLYEIAVLEREPRRFILVSLARNILSVLSIDFHSGCRNILGISKVLHNLSCTTLRCSSEQFFR